MEAARGARSGASAAAAVLVAVMIVGGLAVGGADAEIRQQKNVQVSLRAKWAGTPLLLEACELLSKEWKNLFWDFIEHWKELEKGSECLTAKCCVQKIVEDARSPELCPTYRAFSLPQEWLWCESWCGNATKARAKTIDLCNNPMTKEPKLQGARRIVPEWVDLDSEARQFTAQILGENPESAEVIPSPSDASKPDGKGVDQNLKDEL